MHTTVHTSQVVLAAKNPPANAGDIRDTGSNSGLGRSPREGHGNLLLVFLPWESHGQMSLADYSPCGCEESDTTEVTHHTYTHTHIQYTLYSQYLL